MMKPWRRAWCWAVVVGIGGVISGLVGSSEASGSSQSSLADGTLVAAGHVDSPETQLAGGGSEHCGPWVRGPYVSVQMNTDELGCNIVGDAANQPTLASDPRYPGHIAAGWRHFETINAEFPQNSLSISGDAGRSWSAKRLLFPGQFGSDPVLASDPEANFYYAGLVEWGGGVMHRSSNGGASWEPTALPSDYANQHWFVVDHTTGLGRGNIYYFGPIGFVRLTQHGQSFSNGIDFGLGYGVPAVGAEGEVYVIGVMLGVTGFFRSFDANDVTVEPTFQFLPGVSLGYVFEPPPYYRPNMHGQHCQPWLAADISSGPYSGYLYMLSCGNSAGADPMDVMFMRSDDRGGNWTQPVRVNDDPPGANSWQWMAMMSVAPNGRIDAVWFDTRNSQTVNLSELYYSYSLDAGDTWSPNEPISPVFDSYAGRPDYGYSMGDYCHMTADRLGANVVYVATFNGEQDVYFLRIGPYDCNGNGIADDLDMAAGASNDCNGDLVPDECQLDCNLNQEPDVCEVAEGTQADCDGNFVIDDCEPDCDADGIGDICAILSGQVPDCDGDRNPDLCDLALGEAVDCNANIVPDRCDIAGGTSMDANNNRVPDECDPTVLYVDASHIGAQDGRSWNTAFSNLEIALDEADRLSPVLKQVWVQEGVYVAPMQGFDVPGGISLLGGFSGNELLEVQRRPDLYATVLSGDRLGDDEPDFGMRTDNAYHVVNIDEYDIVLDGLVIRGGNARESYPQGGGILIEQGIVTIRDCNIVDNQAGSGGGFRVANATMTMIDCTLAGNFAQGYGGAGWTWDSMGSFNRCRFIGNTSRGYGAAVNVRQFVIAFEACEFVGNKALPSLGLSNGGALHFEPQVPNPDLSRTIRNCTFSGNAAEQGGALYGLATEMNIENCTFAHNVASGLGGAIHLSPNAGGPMSSIWNCVVWGNADSAGMGESAQVYAPGTGMVDYSSVQNWGGGIPGIGNIGDDPLFFDPLGLDGLPGTIDDNLRLQPDSPAIDAGDPDDTNVPFAVDADGHSRLLCGRIDMGAFEFGIGDVGCDRTVNLFDFNHWPVCQTSPGEMFGMETCLPLDFDGDFDIELRDYEGFQNALGM